MSNSASGILFCANTDWYLYNFRSSLIRSAAAAGYKVQAVTPPGPFGQRLKGLGIEWRALPFARNSRSGMALSLWRTRRALRRTILELRPAVVHSFTLTAILLTWLACPARQGIVRVNAVTGLGFAFTGRSAAHRLLQAALRPLLRRALGGKRAVTVVQNPTDQAFMIERLGLSPDNVRLIAGSGVDTHRFAPKARRRKDVVRVGFVGRLLTDKGIREFVAAALELARTSTPVEFVAAGAPDPGNPAAVGEAELARWKSDTPVQFVGQIDDMPAFLAGLDVFVLPSYREGLSRSLIEACASGLPAVTTDVPGCRDVVTDGQNGLLAPPRDASALAGAIRTLIEDEALRVRMAQASREVAARYFSNDIINQETLDLYRNLVEKA